MTTRSGAVYKMDPNLTTMLKAMLEDRQPQDTELAEERRQREEAREADEGGSSRIQISSYVNAGGN